MRHQLLLRIALSVLALSNLPQLGAQAPSVGAAPVARPRTAMPPSNSTPQITQTPAATGAQSPATPGANASATAADPDLLIASGDLLDVGVFGTDFACSQERTSGCQVRVSGTGEISLPLIGAVKVAGLTTSQAQQSIATRLEQGGFFNNPQVTIVQKEYNTQGISVLGEVQRPGIYPLLGSHTLLDAISAAGGITRTAGNNVSVMHRDQPNQAQQVDLRSAKDSNIPLRPGDTVVVSKAGIVYVVGDVRLPSGVVMESSGLTVLQAIAMAQGTNPTAKLSGARLIRTTAQGRQDIPLALNQILASKAPDPVLQPDDIIFVPTSTAKNAARRSLEAALQTVTGIAIYRR